MSAAGPKMPFRTRMALPALALACGFALLASGCGSDDSEAGRAAPSTAEFPSAKGKDMDQLLKQSGATPSKLVVSPAAQVFQVGDNRYPFGVFTTDKKQVSDADVAMYFAKDSGSVVEGPLPAKVVSLETKPAYRAQGSEAPGEATTVYVVPKVNFDRSGPWLAIAMIKGENGLEASRVPSPTVGQYPDVAKVGQKAPRIHTPTPADVGGDIAKIDTRVPPDNMHKVDFADVEGKKPVVIVFATPALCQSRVCGPVVDVNQQVADQVGDKVDFIHMEVYNDNQINKGIRPQLKAFGLPTEPWTFLIDKNGVIRDRIEGAYGVSELEQALKTILPGSQKPSSS